MKRLGAALLIALLPYWVAIPAWADDIEEDDPAWDCHSMGNHICGPDQDQPIILVGHVGGAIN